ncbi:MAG TPA: CHAT domain-containing protein [Blastocatellia bacterium]|nr:CHAT domain-containing protein [Blastocatellia bacterium]
MSLKSGACFSPKILFLPAVGLCAVAILGVIISGCRRRSEQSSLASGMAELVRACNEHRLVEPRMSGGFHAGKYTSSKEAPVLDAKLIASASDKLLDAAKQAGEPVSSFLRGRLLLAMGDTAKALPLLQAAADGSPNSAEVQNDLGVALYASGQYENALDRFQAALKIRPGMVEALFNLGITYQKLLLRSQAATYFKQLVSSAGDPSWRTEAQQHLSTVSAPVQLRSAKDAIADLADAISKGDDPRQVQIDNRNFYTLQLYVTRDLPIQYLEAESRHDSEAAGKALSQLKQISSLFLNVNHDTFDKDLTDHLAALTEDQRPIELKMLTEYRDAVREVNAGGDLTAVGKSLQRLSVKFHLSGNEAYAGLAHCYVGTAYYQAGRYNDSLAAFNDFLARFEGHQWIYQQCVAINQAGVSYSLIGEDSLAIKYCERALALCRQGREPEMKTLQFLADPYWHLGDLDQTLKCLQDSTSLFLEGDPEFKELAYNYLQMADVYRLEDRGGLAIQCAKAALDFAHLGNSHYLEAQASSFAAVLQAAANNFTDAEQSLDGAMSALEATRAGERQYTEPQVLTRAGDVLLREHKPEDAIHRYVKAEGLAAHHEGDISLVVNPLEGMANAYIALGKNSEAHSALKKAIATIENNRNRIQESRNRMQYLDATQSAFDQMISLDIALGGQSTSEAFQMSEKSRARSLLDEIYSREIGGKAEPENPPTASTALSKREIPPIGLKDIAGHVPEDEAVLEYAVTDRGTYIFVITAAGMKVARSPVTAEELGGKVRRYVVSLKARQPVDELKVAAHEIYRDIMAPVVDFAGPLPRLCIIPDKSLHFLPFASLVDDSGRYLIESRTLTYAPSAAVLLKCFQKDRDKGKYNPETMLAVGNPSFDRTAFPNLADLPSAEGEARQVAGLYKESSLLVGADATKDKFRSALRAREVAHLAVHCVVSESSPWLAALVLAKPSGQKTDSLNVKIDSSGESTGALYLNDIYSLDMPRTRLVVLAACESGLGEYYKGEGIVSVVRPFIAASVPMVVASLWPVESDSTAQLMVAFERMRKNGGKQTASALRDAQCQMINTDAYSHPYYWAAFVAIGSNDSPAR